MTAVSFKPGRATLAAAAAALALTFALALAGSWLWFQRAPAPMPLNPARLDAQAGKPGTKRGQDGKHEADPYKAQAIKTAIRQHAPALQKPWLAYLANQPARPAGTVTLDWTIAADGRATQVSVAHSDFDNAAFNNGVRAAVAAIAFPPPPGGQPYHVTHRLFFRQEPASAAKAK